ncbi:LD-carboxypeptidase [Streptomyces sp. NPDC056549]|uniref:S66 peptidase family protein n=1 Tax=Streptomyces sp. NPDC056549 TaxID=3345864 RepID=UPI0036845F7B
MTAASLLPTPLSKGDRVGIVTLYQPEHRPPAFSPASLVFRSCGFEPVLSPPFQTLHGHRSVNEGEILDNFHAFIVDPSITAVVCEGGNDRANRLLRGVDFPLIAAHPKPIVGLNAPSLLLNAITARTGLPTFHGPDVTSECQSPDLPGTTIDQFIRLVSGHESVAHIDAPLFWGRPGTAEGHLVAGCLSSLRCLIGTPFAPRWQGALVAWQDAFTLVDVLDQTLTHFGDAGILDQIAGLVVGELQGCAPKQASTIRDTIMEVCDEYAFPVAFGLPSASPTQKYTLAIGAQVSISPAQGIQVLSPWSTSTENTR